MDAWLSFCAASGSRRTSTDIAELAGKVDVLKVRLEQKHVADVPCRLSGCRLSKAEIQKWQVIWDSDILRGEILAQRRDESMQAPVLPPIALQQVM